MHKCYPLFMHTGICITNFKRCIRRINPKFRIVLIFGGGPGHGIRAGYKGTFMASVIFYGLSNVYYIIIYVCLHACDISWLNRCFQRVSESNREQYCVCWDQKPVSWIPPILGSLKMDATEGPAHLETWVKSPHLWTPPEYIVSSPSPVKYNWKTQVKTLDWSLF